MKKTPLFIILLVASFIGVLGALQVDRLMSKKGGYSGPDVVLGSAPQLMPAAFEQDAAGAVDFRGAAKRVIPSVVSVNQYQRINTLDPYGSDGSPERLTETGSGSGVIVSGEGYIVTNNHVVTDPRTRNVVDQVRVTLEDKRTLIAKVVGTDPRSDLAVLKIDAPNLQPIELGDSTKIDIGQWVLAVGNPLGFTNTVSVGVVSSLNRSLSIQGHALINGIQTDAAINPGNSGGALTDASGRLIGINSAIASTTRASIGIGFAIPVNRVKQVVQDIIKTGHPSYAGIGVSYVQEWDGILADPRARAEVAQQTGAEPPTKGILIRYVAPNSSAAQLGLKPLDVLMEINGKVLEDSLTLNQALLDKKPGDRVSLKYWSRGSVKTTDVTLQEVGS
jgi:serine protease Do